MDHPAAPLLCSEVPRPARGASTRLQQGRLEMVLEAVRGGHQLVVHDGHRGRRHFLGIPPEGELLLRALPPEHPVVVELEDQVTLAAGGRVRGYVLVPLRRKLVCRTRNGEQGLVEVLPMDLATEWDEATGYQHRVSSPFLVHGRALREDPRALVPVVLHNLGTHPCTPGELTVELDPAELWEGRGRVLAAPRRFELLASGEVVTRARMRIGQRQEVTV